MIYRFSVSNDLKYDAERDLKDIDALNIPVHALNKVFIPLSCSTLLRKNTLRWLEMMSLICVLSSTDKVWRHSYLRGGAVRHVLCSDW